jgi:hypothetical protein
MKINIILHGNSFFKDRIEEFKNIFKNYELEFIVSTFTDVSPVDLKVKYIIKHNKNIPLEISMMNLSKILNPLIKEDEIIIHSKIDSPIISNNILNTNLENEDLKNTVISLSDKSYFPSLIDNLIFTKKSFRFICSKIANYSDEFSSYKDSNLYLNYLILSSGYTINQI